MKRRIKKCQLGGFRKPYLFGTEDFLGMNDWHHNVDNIPFPDYDVSGETQGTDSSNPIEPLLKQLKQDIGKVGTVLAWHMSFEKSRNSEMAEMLPEYKDFINRTADEFTPAPISTNDSFTKPLLNISLNSDTEISSDIQVQKIHHPL